MLHADVVEVQTIVKKTDALEDALSVLKKQDIAEFVRSAFLQELADSSLSMLVEPGISEREANAEEVIAAIKEQLLSDAFLDPYIASIDASFSHEEIQDLLHFFQHKSMKKISENRAVFSPIYLGVFQLIQTVTERYPEKKHEDLAIEQTPVIPMITSDNFQKEVLESDLPVILDVYGDFCPPCKQMAPIFAALSTELQGKVKFVKINGQSKDTFSIINELEVKGLPSFFFFKDGKIVDKHVGIFEKEDFIMKLAKAFL